MSRVCGTCNGLHRARPLAWLVLLAVLCCGSLRDLTTPVEILEAETSQPSEEKDQSHRELDPISAGRGSAWRIQRMFGLVAVAIPSPTLPLGHARHGLAGSPLGSSMRVRLRC